MATEGDLAVLASDRHDAQIGVCAQPRIKDNLLPAVVPTLREARVINKAKVDRLLDLVHIVSRQENVGDMRLQQFHFGDHVWVHRRIEECAD
jgi:hypothetical protein